MTFDADELEKRIVDKLAKDPVISPVTYTMQTFIRVLCLALQEMQEAQDPSIRMCDGCGLAQGPHRHRSV